MNSVIILFALSALIGFVLGHWLSWYAILISSMGLATLSAAVLQMEGFGALSGIAIVVTCLTFNQLAYFVGLLSRGLERGPRKSENQTNRQKDAEARGWTRSH
jgi:hypothetical protein